MATENNDSPETRGVDDLGAAVQVEFPDLFTDCPSRREVVAAGGPSFGGAGIISKRDLAMIRGRRKKD